MNKSVNTVFQTLISERIKPDHIRLVTKTTILTQLKTIPVTTTSSTIRVINSLRPLATKIISSRISTNDRAVFHEIITNLTNELSNSTCVENT